MEIGGFAFGGQSLGEEPRFPHSCARAIVREMPCIVYRRLVTQWMMLITLPHSNQVAVSAYWEAIEHRTNCETCRDETLAEGCSDIYAVIAATTH